MFYHTRPRAQFRATAGNAHTPPGAVPGGVCGAGRRYALSCSATSSEMVMLV